MYFFFPMFTIKNNNKEYYIKEFEPFIDFVEEIDYVKYNKLKKEYFKNIENNHIIKIKKKSKKTIIISADNYIKSFLIKNDIIATNLQLSAFIKYSKSDYDLIVKNKRDELKKEGYDEFYGSIYSNLIDYR